MNDIYQTLIAQSFTSDSNAAGSSQSMAWLAQNSAWLAQNSVNFFLQSTALILIGLIAAKLLKKQGSAVQSAIYRATLVAVIACPLAAMGLSYCGFSGWTFELPEATKTVSVIAAPKTSTNSLKQFDKSMSALLQSGDSSVRSQFLPPNEVVSGDMNRLSAEVVLAQFPADSELLSTPSISESATEQPAQMPVASPTFIEKVVPNSTLVICYSIIGAVWLVGSLVFLGKLLLAFYKLRKIRNESPLAPTGEVELCHDMAGRINVIAPDVRRNSLLSSPCLTGITSPTILLPTEIEDRLPLEKAFAHELAHLRRRDTLWNLIQRSALAIFFFQPLLWRLVYRLETTAEEVCDDFVVRHCLDRTGYAQQLVQLAESNFVAPHMAGLEMASLRMFSRKTMLSNRVVRILDTTRKLTTSVSAPIVAAISALTLSAAMLSGLIGNGTLNQSEIVSSTVSELPAEADGKQVIVSGRVVGADGKPVAGAKLTVMANVNHNFANRKKNGPYADAVSKSDGTYEVSFSDAMLVESGHTHVSKKNNFVVVATKNGHGLSWIEGSKVKVQNSSDGKIEYRDADIKLVSNETPLRLKIVDTEGNSVAGATVKVNSLRTFKNNDFGPILENARKKLHFHEAVVRYMDDSLLFPGLPEYVTDSKGEVVIEGVGDNRLVDIEVNGEPICSTNSQHMTIDHPMISFDYGGMMTHSIKYHGANVTITCEPTQPIVGKVVDRKTQQPLAGVEIFSDQFAGEALSGIHRIKTKTKADGTFRLVGMPKGPGNSIAIVPNDDQPYFMATRDVPVAAGLAPVEMKVELDKGIWIRGKATDKKTGEPIAGARLAFLPFLSNKFAATSSVVNGSNFGPATIQDRYTTAADGSYQLLGLPGKSIVGLLEIDGRYPAGAGFETIDKEEIDQKRGNAKTFHNPITPFKGWPSAMQQIELAADANELNLDFELESGLSFPLKVVDDRGNPLSGVTTYRLRSSSDYGYESTDSTVDAGSFQPDEQRTVRFVHKEKGLARIIQLDAAKEDPDKPRTVQLKPYATIKGRLVNKDGDPVVGGKVHFDVGRSQDFGMRLSERTTNENGEFVHEAICPGTYYSITVTRANEFRPVAKKVDVTESEEINLGTINIYDVENSPAPKRRPKPKSESKSFSDSGAKKKIQEDDDSNAPDSSQADKNVNGIVLDEAGKPVADADVYMMQSDWKTDFGWVRNILGRGKSDSKGNFKISFQYDNSGEAKVNHHSNIVVAFHKKFAPNWSDVDIKQSSSEHEIELKNPKSFSYQLIDVDGQPVADAKIEIHSYRATGNSHELHFNNPEHLLELKSDKNGWFELSQFAANGSVTAWVHADGMVLQHVILRLITLDDYQRLYDRDPPSGNVHLAKSKIVCAPGMEVTGIVRDSESKKPLPGVTVQIGKVFNRKLKAVSDTNGRYRVSGIPVSNRHDVNVQPGQDQCYLKRGYLARFEETQQQHDIELHKGVWIEGQVTDKNSGDPVSKAIVYHLPLETNPNLGDYPEYDGRFRDSRLNLQSFSGDDGRFRLVGIKGPALFGIKADGFTTEESLSKYSDKVAGVNADLRVFMNIGREVNFDEATNRIDLQLEKGVNIKVATFDKEGKPVTGVRVSGHFKARHNITESTINGSELVIHNFGDDETRLVKFRHNKRRLGVVKEISLQAIEAGYDLVRVRLQPLSTVKFSLVDGNNDPVDGSVYFVLPDETQLDQSLQVMQIGANGKPIYRVQSKDGKFQYDVPAGTKYKLRFISQAYPFGITIRKDLSVSPGEEIDLGTIDVTDPLAKTKVSVAKPANEQEQTLTFSGKVVDSKGNHVPDATISMGPKHETKSNSDGSFVFAVPKKLAMLQPSYGTSFLITKEGFGRTYCSVKGDDRSNLTFELVDGATISGKLIDTEGNPVSGARIEVERVIDIGTEAMNRLIESAANSAKPVQLSGHRILQSKIKPVVSAIDGTFTLAGFGAGRAAHLKIIGDNVAIQKTVVMTSVADVKNIESYFGSLTSEPAKVFGNEPTLVCIPSQPIEGIVIDQDTKRPIPNVEISSYSFAGTDPRSKYVGQRVLKTTSDKSGRFRLTGMPNTIGNEIMAVSKINESDQPYLAKVFEVLPGTAGTPIEMELRLQKGVWITGKVVDQDTNQPLGNVRMGYYPASDNEAALETKTGQSGLLTDIDPRTDKDGNYKLIGVPGKGVVTALVHMTRDYPPKQGWLDVDEELRNKVRFNANHLTGIKSVMIDKADKQGKLNFGLTKGKTVKIKTVDESGIPVNGVNVTFLPIYLNRESKSEKAEFELGGFLPGRQRTLVMQTPDKRMGAKVKIESDSEGTVEVVLKKSGRIKAKVVDGKARPIKGLKFRIDLLEGVRQIWTMHSIDPTNDEGSFEQSLMPGMYLISFTSPITGEFSGYKKLKVDSGGTVDLGEINVSETFSVTTFSNPSNLNGFVKDLPAIQSNMEKDQSDKSDDSAELPNRPNLTQAKVKVTGKVSDLSGKPVADASVKVQLRYRPELMPDPIAATTTDAEGRFELEYSSDYFENRPRLQFDEFNTSLLVAAEGYVNNWIAVKDIVVPQTGAGETGLASKALDLEHEFLLSKDFAQLGFQLIDLEGNPIQGDVTAEVLRIEDFSQSFNASDFAGSSESEFNNAFRRSAKNIFYPSAPLVFESDGQGRVKLSNVGKNRVFWIKLSGKNIANRYLTIASGLKKSINYQGDEETAIHANGSKIVCDAGQTVVGRVTDSKTGKPIPGVKLVGFGSAAAEHSIRGIFRSQSDMNGKFSIIGAGVGEGNTFYAVAENGNDDSKYLARRFRLPASDRGKKQTFDIKLHPGKEIKVRVSDLATGKPIQNAKLFYSPLKSNPINKLYPEHQSLWVMQNADGETRLTDSNGEARLIGHDGQGIVGVRVEDKSITANQGWSAISQQLGETAFDITARHPIGRTTAIRLVEIDSSQEEVTLNIKIDRTPINNKELSGRVTDESGNAIAGATVRFQTWKTYPILGHQLLGETLTLGDGSFKLSIPENQIGISNLSPVGNGLAGLSVQANGYGSLEMQWNDKRFTQEFENGGPIQIELEQDNVINGRVVNLEGRPVADAEIEITSTKSLGSKLADKWQAKLTEVKDYPQASNLVWNIGGPRLNWTTGSYNHLLQTDKNGEFKSEGLPKDSIVHIQIRHPEITTQMIEILNRKMESNKADEDYIVHGDRPLIVAQPCRPIVGKVIDSKTGNPIPGVKIYCKRIGIANTVYGTSVAPRTHSDEDGNFELLGMPKSSRSRLMVYPPADLPYLIQEISSIPETVGMQPANITVKLEQGVWITGQVTDEKTGSGVKAQINYWPLADNPHFQAATGFQKGNRQDHYGFFDNYRTDFNGAFKVVGLPGKAVLGATVNGQEYRSGVGIDRLLEELGEPYSQQQIEAAKKVGRDLSNKKFLNIRSSYSLKNVSGSSYVPIDVPASGLELRDSIEMDSGFDLEFRVVGPNGELVKNFFCSNFDGFHTQKDFANGVVTLNRMGAKESRTLWLSNKENSLAVVTTINGEMSKQKERSITLQPRAKVRGRLVDAAGKPLSNYQLKITYFDEAKTTSDKDGYFEFDRLVVGRSEFDITIHRPKLGPDEERAMELGMFTEFNVKKRLVAGGLLHIGDVTVDPTDYWMISGMLE